MLDRDDLVLISLAITDDGCAGSQHPPRDLHRLRHRLASALVVGGAPEQ
jgi:hypothetical protein